MPPTAANPRRTPAQLAADGFAVLVEKLGVTDAVRFLQLYHPGRGDYTRDRREWLDALTIEDVSRLVAERTSPDQQPAS